MQHLVLKAHAVEADEAAVAPTLQGLGYDVACAAVYKRWSQCGEHRVPVKLRTVLVIHEKPVLKNV